MMTLNRKLLIVDDEDGIRESIAELVCDRIGAECIQASNGKEALERVMEHNPDAILSDIRMPEMTGLELLQQIRRLGLDTPFVLLTAFADRENTVEALRLGATDFLEKPVDENTIVENLSAALELGYRIKKMERELDEFCSQLPSQERDKVEAYRKAKRASLSLKIQYHMILAKKPA